MYYCECEKRSGSYGDYIAEEKVSVCCDCDKEVNFELTEAECDRLDEQLRAMDLEWFFGRKL